VNPNPELQMNWIAGSDHAGFAMKQHLVALLRALGDDVEDLGPHSEAAVDYPAYGAAVARAAVARGARGLLVCGTGIGIAIAANKIAGARCAVVTDEYTALMARSHNDANLIALGARVVGIGVAERAVQVFREQTFLAAKHGRRVDQLAALERDGGTDALTAERNHPAT